MVETYSKESNRNMRRPIVKEEIVAFMRERQDFQTGFLKELEDFAARENVPVIPRETAAYFRWFLQVMQPQSILEIGTAIGYSALLMAENSPQAHITTIDRNEEMIGLAKQHFAAYDSRKQITLLEGEAAEVLSGLPDNHYDFVFMDSAKSKYIVFLPEVLKKVKLGGVVVLDDIFQGGDVTLELADIHRSQRAIYRGLHRLFDATLHHPDLTVSFLPMSDGLLLLRKNAENVLLEAEN